MTRGWNLRKKRSLPLYKLAAKVRRKIRETVRYQRDLRQSTYGDFCPGDLYTYFPAIPVADLQPLAPQVAALTEHYLAHRFDLLGSGWVQVKYGMASQGLEGYRYNPGQAVQADPKGCWLEQRINAVNVSEAKRIWQLQHGDYAPIDWQLDFKSGYRWREMCWYRHIPYGHLPGADIKVPWELARAQHLPQLALGYAFAAVNQSGFERPEVYVREFRSQILDFISTNPPRFGVNWACTMDVAIRVVNWLVAYDLFRAYGAIFDDAFSHEFMRSVYQHGEHIVTNLEWRPDWRSNHYLANIAGLAFVAAYLPQSPHSDVWLAFALQELAHETRDQFNDDGSNFEASTCYHRLSAEMVVYATALALGLPTEKQAALETYNPRLYRFPRPLQPPPLHYMPDGARLEKMAEFTLDITKSNGQVPQIGDNDNGRFLKLLPVYQQMTSADVRTFYTNLDGYKELPDDTPYWDEDVLDHRHLPATINGLFRRDDLPITLETTIVSALAKNQRLHSYRHDGKVPCAEMVRIGEDWLAACDSIHQLSNVNRLVIPLIDVRDNLKTYGYPDFGLYLFRSRRLCLAVRCGSIGQRGSGGHAHNDQLSIELNVDGEDWIVDPGTYLYTPLPEQRNMYRSVKAHFAPQLAAGEPGRLDLGLFQLGDEAQAKCLYFRKEGFLGVHYGYGVPLFRLITIEDDSVVIEDAAANGSPLRLFQGDRWPERNIMRSPKYGSRSGWATDESTSS